MSPEATADRDERLARLFEELSEQQRRGLRPDVEAVARQHPDLADELRQLVNLAQIADAFARPASSGTRATLPLPRASQVAPEAAAGPPPRFFDGYELIEEIGRGAMGVVYKAWESSLQRFVALKMVLRGEHASAADLARFRGEAQAAARLSHRNIVPVYKVGEQGGQAYFCMEYVAGTTLSAAAAAGPLPQERAARYLAAIARAVHHAHEHGILHRDLKPSNVLLDGDDQPRVTDFGLAKRVEGGATLTGTGAIVGTPSYMAPEQAAGGEGKVGPPADIYALGAILYELLTGRPPFQGASVWDVLLLVRTEEPVRPRLLNRKIDPDLEMICLKCLEKRPEHRYGTALALAEDLERFLQSEPVEARTSSLAYFVGRLFRETHHAPVMENWGGLWMVHSVKIFLLCAVTNWMLWEGFDSHLPYLLLWSIGLVTWGSLFWAWRRRGGPVTFVERQVAHAWGAGVAASIGMFVVEVLLGLPVLTLSPVLAIAAGMVFVMKAGTLTGWFYVAAILSFLTAIPMALFPQVGPLLFGLVSAVGFFVPGLKYYLQRRRSAPPPR
jgi:serine/threonine-protein kinase